MNRLHLIAGASAVGLAVLLYYSAPATAPRTKAPETADFLVRDVRLFDGERIWPRAAVRVRDGLIDAVTEELTPKGGERVIDGTGKTLLPGLIDAHVHSWGEARRDALRFGTTAQIDMFTDHSQLPAARAERESMDRTAIADLWSAGTLATAAGGHGTQYGMPIPTVDSIDDAAAWVAAREAEGSDFIKIVREDLSAYGPRRLPSLDAEHARAVIDAAHARDLRAVVHASTLEAAREAIRDGANGLVHVFQDRIADAEFVALAQQRDAFVVPTLTVIAGISGEASTLVDDPLIEPWLSPGQRGTLESAMSFGATRGVLISNARESVRRLHAAGIMILAGTDAPNPNTAHGASLHEELAQLVQAGLTPLEALRAATSLPADAFGLDGRGRIKAGNRADLMLVEGKPDTDIQATRAIVTIWKNGHVVERALSAPNESAQALDSVALGSISDFDGDAIESSYGSGWMLTTDSYMGGTSSAEMRRVAGGAAGSAGALRVEGEVRAQAAQLWAGVMFNPSSQTMQAVDASAARELVFWLRGDGRELTVLLFHGETQFPAMRSVPVSAQWSEHVLPLADFAGADLAQLRAIGYTVGAPAGAFWFEIDEVALR